MPTLRLGETELPQDPGPQTVGSGSRPRTGPGPPRLGASSPLSAGKPAPRADSLGGASRGVGASGMPPKISTLPAHCCYRSPWGVGTFNQGPLGPAGTRDCGEGAEKPGARAGPWLEQQKEARGPGRKVSLSLDRGEILARARLEANPNLGPGHASLRPPLWTSDSRRAPLSLPTSPSGRGLGNEAAGAGARVSPGPSPRGPSLCLSSVFPRKRPDPLNVLGELRP